MGPNVLFCSAKGKSSMCLLYMETDIAFSIVLQKPRSIIHSKQLGFLERTLQYYYHATPGKPLQGFPGVA